MRKEPTTKSLLNQTNVISWCIKYQVIPGTCSPGRHGSLLEKNETKLSTTFINRWSPDMKC